jgi:1,4-alpha-glucan branching enzyme
VIKITKKGNKAWVTFAVAPSETLASVEVAGEWNDWKNEPMKQKKNGEYAITKVLKTGNSYQFGYRINGESWQKEDELPAVASPFGSENSLLKL